MSEHVVIAGASHAGVAAADQLRRLGFSGRLTMISREHCAPYQRPLLSKAPDLLELPVERMAIRKPEFFADNKIDLLLGCEIVEVNGGGRFVSLGSGERLEYDDLVLATGARARTLSSEVVSGNAPSSVRTIEEALRFRGRLGLNERLVVIGAGLIGLEVAALARQAGLQVTVLEAGDRVMGRVVPASVSRYVQDYHGQSGIDIRLGVGVARVYGHEQGYSITLSTEEVIEAGSVLVAIGTEPETSLAKSANLETDNGILTSASGRTSVERIWAIGDCANWQLSPSTDDRIRFEAIQPATEQAKIVAYAITGQDAGPLPLPRFWSHQGDLRLQMAGILPDRAEWARGLVAKDGLLELATVEGIPVACFAVNAPGAFREATRLIEGNTRVSQDEVATLLAS